MQRQITYSVKIPPIDTSTVTSRHLDNWETIRSKYEECFEHALAAHREGIEREYADAVASCEQVQKSRTLTVWESDRRNRVRSRLQAQRNISESSYVERVQETIETMIPSRPVMWVFHEMAIQAMKRGDCDYDMDHVPDVEVLSGLSDDDIRSDKLMRVLLFHKILLANEWKDNSGLALMKEFGRRFQPEIYEP